METMAFKIAPLRDDDPRVKHPLFTAAEAAVYLRVPPSTFSTWLRTDQKPGGIVTAFRPRRSGPVIPFVGLAEGLALAAFRRAGVPLQRIRPALMQLEAELGLQHALASDRLFTDGVEVLYDYGVEQQDDRISELVVVRKQQRVFVPIVEQYLKRIKYGPDHWAAQVALPGYEQTRVIVDLRLAFGRPIIERARVPVEEIVDRWWAGDSIAALAADFSLEPSEVEDVIRAATRISAA